MARIGASLDPDATRRGSVDRQPPAGRDLPRHGGRRQARDHGRADGVADPPRGRRAACASSRDLKRAGICIVFVSHRLDEVMEIAERVTVLRDGAKVGDLRGARDGRPEARDADDRQGLRLSDLGGGFRRGGKRCSRVRHLSRAGQYEDVSLDIRAGEILGMTGLARLGPHRIRAVAVRHEPADVRRDPARRQAARAQDQSRRRSSDGIAYVSEDRLNLGLVLEQPISSNILVTMLDKLARPAGPGARGDAASGRRRNGSRTWRSRRRIRTMP